MCEFMKLFMDDCCQVWVYEVIYGQLLSCVSLWSYLWMIVFRCEFMKLFMDDCFQCRCESSPDPVFRVSVPCTLQSPEGSESLICHLPLMSVLFFLLCICCLPLMYVFFFFFLLHIYCFFLFVVFPLAVPPLMYLLFFLLCLCCFSSCFNYFPSYVFVLFPLMYFLPFFFLFCNVFVLFPTYIIVVFTSYLVFMWHLSSVK